ncbi:transmembrane cell adhesion receptor mua-3-like isoform X2 [Mya arenaria]|nr:transmembrane cell adhesion receptor mua-3-like isoform X2 [Mya arenaria]
MWVSLTRSCYGLGEACTADDSSNCTGTGVVCHITCVCDSNHYPSNGGCTEKIDLGFSGCTNGNAVNECADDNTECIAGFCKCVSTHYDNNGDTSRGECDKKKKLGEGCSTNQDCTSSDSNSECSGNKCQCQSSYYDDNGNNAEGTCASKVNLEGTCTATTSGSGDPCNTAFAMCTGSESSYTCKCQGGYYKSDGNTCSKVGVALRSSCTIPTSESGTTITDACKITFAECMATSDASTTTCQCTATHYTYGSECRQKKKLREGCSTNQDCTSSDSNSECSGNKCQCQSSYYDDNGNNAEGMCASKVNLEGTCTAATSGSGDPCNAKFAVCTGRRSSYTCKCQGGYYKSGGNTCSKVGVALRSSCTIPTSESGTTITDACKITFAECMATNDASTTTCQCTATHYTYGSECRQKKKLGEGCSTNQDCTSSDSNSECSGNKCQCHSSYYDDNGNNAEGTCASKVNLEGTCTAATSGSGDPCNTKFAVCTGRRSSYTCKCQGGYYKSGGNTCSKVGVALRSSCTIPTSESGTTITDACKITFAECMATSDASTTTCQCTATHYTYGSECRQKKKLGEGCSTNQDCTSSDSNSECSGNKCQCQSSYYDDNGNNAEGTCASKVNLEGTCTAATSGSGDPCNTKFAVCTGRRSSYTCKCQGGYYKSGGNTCSKVGVALRSSCTIPTSESGTTITDACKITFAECMATSDASTTTCQCTATHYTYGSECRQRQQLGEICSSHKDCISFDKKSKCGTSRTCQCQTNYYDSDGSINVGGTCTSKVGLGSACPRPDAC